MEVPEWRFRRFLAFLGASTGLFRTAARIVPPFGDRLLGFSVASPPSVPVVAARSVPPGWVWEGATAPLPIEHDVSEANSFSGGSGGEPNGKVIHRAGVVRASFLLNIF